MREQRLFLGQEEIYNGEAHERDGVYEIMRLRGKVVSLALFCYSFPEGWG